MTLFNLTPIRLVGHVLCSTRWDKMHFAALQSSICLRVRTTLNEIQNKLWPLFSPVVHCEWTCWTTYGLCCWYPAVDRWHKRLGDWLPHLLCRVYSPESELHPGQAGDTPPPTQKLKQRKTVNYMSRFIFVEKLKICGVCFVLRPTLILTVKYTRRHEQVFE